VEYALTFDVLAVNASTGLLTDDKTPLLSAQNEDAERKQPPSLVSYPPPPPLLIAGLCCKHPSVNKPYVVDEAPATATKPLKLAIKTLLLLSFSSPSSSFYFFFFFFFFLLLLVTNLQAKNRVQQE
jgi:hypothetical protein